MRIQIIITFLLFTTVVAAESPHASMKTNMTRTSAENTLSDIQKTLGLVPIFLKQFPENALPGAWQTFKAIQLSDKTLIPGKYKELLGLACASQIPCHYCVYFHTEAAKLNGATDAEIKEAVALAAHERQWSTFLNGTSTDETVFRSQVDQIMKKISARNSDATANSAIAARLEFDSPEAALKDTEETLGLVPDFVKQFPKEGIAGAWSETKALLMTNSAIPGKYKDLISLSVASQVPCSRCIYWDTQSAKTNGATQDEINETIALSSIMRHWSTVLNGLQTDEATFKKEVNKVFANARKNSAKKVS